MNPLLKAAQLIQEGQLVAFPTETVYGLGADAFNEAAIQKIYEIKGRPSQNPLIVHISDIAQLPLLTDQIGEKEKALITAFWPGPLTLIFPKKKTVPDLTTGGLPTVAVRMPAHPLALELLEKAKTPIAAPSANPSGKPSATHHDHVHQYFGDELFILDGGATQHGLESTVVQIKNGLPHIYRLGSITPEDIEAVLACKPVLETQSKHSPGTRFKHYAPEAAMELLSPEAILKRIQTHDFGGQKIGLLASEEMLTQLKNTPHHLASFSLGTEKELLSVGSRIYSGLIALDALKLDKIVVQSFPEEGLGRTIMDRLRRASGQL